MDHFYVELKTMRSNIGKNNILLTDERYDELIAEVITLKCSQRIKSSLIVVAK